MTGIVLLSVGAILLGASVYLMLSNSQQYTLLPETPAKDASLYKASRHYCAVAGTAVVCQEVRNGKASKYSLPEKLGDVTAVIPSPDGTKFLVRTAANPINIDEADHVYITDSVFKVLQELPTDKKSSYGSFAWTDANSNVALARRNNESGKTKIARYDLTAKKEQPLGGDTPNSVVLYPSADGKFIFVEERTADKPKLTAIELRSGKSKAVRTDSLLEHMQAYANVGYDDTANTFYVSGSGKQGADANKPVLAIAKVAPGNKELELEILKVVSDGYAYVPLQPSDQGMLASRRKDAGPEFGTVSPDGSFKAVDIRPAPAAAFGTVEPLSLSAAASNELTASDYVYSLVDTPAELNTYLQSLTNLPGCPAGVYNYVGLLAQDGNQAAVRYIACGTAPAELQYYSRQGGSYAFLGKSFGAPECQLRELLQLSETVAPSCVAH